MLNNSNAQINRNQYGQPVYPQYQMYPQQQQIVFLPGPPQYQAHNYQPVRFNHDSYAADQPNTVSYPNLNQQNNNTGK